MTPIDALMIAIQAAALSSRALRPGEVVAHLPKDVRRELERLTSDDSLKLRGER